MVDHELLEAKLNEEARKILALIKNDYYQFFSDKKREVIDSYLNGEKVVIVNRGVSIYRDNTIAHGGRTLGDGKIHFYPDVRDYSSTEEAFEKCKGLLPHECFHFFIQPDDLDYKEEDPRRPIAGYYTEGLVEKEARKFYEKHKDTVTFEKANYGFNINFVNMIQARVGATEYTDIFSEKKYLIDVDKYKDEYESVLESKKALLAKVPELIKVFPLSFQAEMYQTIRTLIKQDGSLDSAIQKINSCKSFRIEDLDDPDDPDV